MTYEIINTVPVWGAPEAQAVEQILNCKKDAYGVALMADHHLGYAVPIGGVVAYKDKISPSGVGFDIACGNKAVLTNLKGADVRRDIKSIMDQVFKDISFGVGQNNNEIVDHALFDSPTWQHPAVFHLKRMASQQLGTIGSGNHYVDLFIDERDQVWIGVHFGSRGLGHKTASFFLEKAGGKDGMMVDAAIIDMNTPLGNDYWECMELAGQYAYAGRDWVCSKVASILGAEILEEVHNHHNFAWKERHDGEDLIVVRKGATPAFPGQKGFVGGSMGDISVIIEGVDHVESKLSFSSTVHGAGRVLGRRKAAGKMKWVRDGTTGRKALLKLVDGLISRDMMNAWIEPMGVELRGAGTDESPHCYKRLPEVLEAHKNSIRVLHTLTPIGVAMAGENELDPYKD